MLRKICIPEDARAVQQMFTKILEQPNQLWRKGCRRAAAADGSLCFGVGGESPRRPKLFNRRSNVERQSTIRNRSISTPPQHERGGEGTNERWMSVSQSGSRIFFWFSLATGTKRGSRAGRIIVISAGSGRPRTQTRAPPPNNATANSDFIRGRAEGRRTEES